MAAASAGRSCGSLPALRHVKRARNMAAASAGSRCGSLPALMRARHPADYRAQNKQFHPHVVVTSAKACDQRFAECIDHIKNQSGVQVVYLPPKHFRSLPSIKCDSRCSTVFPCMNVRRGASRGCHWASRFSLLCFSSYNEGLIQLLEVTKKVSAAVQALSLSAQAALSVYACAEGCSVLPTHWLRLCALPDSQEIGRRRRPGALPAQPHRRRRQGSDFSCCGVRVFRHVHALAGLSAICCSRWHL